MAKAAYIKSGTRALCVQSRKIVVGTAGADPSCVCNSGPLGACCATDGSCSNLTQAACAAAGGTWKGAGTDCATTVCPSPPPPPPVCCTCAGVKRPIPYTTGTSITLRLSGSVTAIARSCCAADGSNRIIESANKSFTVNASKTFSVTPGCVIAQTFTVSQTVNLGTVDFLLCNGTSNHFPGSTGSASATFRISPDPDPCYSIFLTMNGGVDSIASGTTNINRICRTAYTGGVINTSQQLCPPGSGTSFFANTVDLSGLVLTIDGISCCDAVSRPLVITGGSGSGVVVPCPNCSPPISGTTIPSL